MTGIPTHQYGSTGESQDALDYAPANSSTVFFTTDLSEMYNSTTSAKRGIRYLNGRRQVLLRDEINTSGTIQWRMHTNATVTLSDNNMTASLALGGETLVATLRSPSGAAFSTQEPAARLSSDPTTTVNNGQTWNMSPDQPNPGVTVLMIELAAGDQTIEVLFNVRRCLSPACGRRSRKLTHSSNTAAMVRLVAVELCQPAEHRARFVVAHLARVKRLVVCYYFSRPLSRHCSPLHRSSYCRSLRSLSSFTIVIPRLPHLSVVSSCLSRSHFHGLRTCMDTGFSRCTKSTSCARLWRHRFQSRATQDPSEVSRRGEWRPKRRAAEPAVKGPEGSDGDAQAWSLAGSGGMRLHVCNAPSALRID